MHGLKGLIAAFIQDADEIDYGVCARDRRPDITIREDTCLDGLDGGCITLDHLAIEGLRMANRDHNARVLSAEPLD